MSDEHVPNGATVRLGRVEGELKVGNNAVIQAAHGRSVVVTDRAQFSGSARLECDMECDSLVVERSGRLVLSGSLTVHGTLDVSNAIEVAGTLAAQTVDVGGHVRAGAITCNRMRVGGTAEVSRSLKADTVDIGGRIGVGGDLDVKDLQVGGKAEVGGGSITGIINVGGRFESSAKLQFGELQVYGVGALAAGSKGRKLVASGKLESDGDLECEEVQVFGVASIRGNCSTLRLEVKGKMSVDGSLSATEDFNVSGMAEVRDTLSAGGAKINGRLEARKVIIAKGVEVYGFMETSDGMKAASVLLGSGSRCRGPLIAQTVEVGSSGPGLSAFAWGQRIRLQAGTSQVDDIYAERVVLGRDSRAGRIFAKNVKVASGCNLDEVTYVDELKMADHVKIVRTVKKVDKLLEPPI